MYIPQIPQTIAQARALAMKIGDARSNFTLWEVPVEQWLTKANKPAPRYRITGSEQLYLTINDLAKDLGLKVTKCRQSLKTGEEIYHGHIVQQVLSIDNKIMKVMPPLNSDDIKIR